MKNVLLSLTLSLFAFGAGAPAFAETPAGAAPAASDCESKAVDKNGKPLAGAAKASFLKKCEKDAAATSETKAATEKPAAK